MGRENPRKAVMAILPPTIAAGGCEVRPMTLGMYAALERIGSPLVTGDEPKDLIELIPSLYLITHDPRDIFKGNLLEMAMEWADAQPVGVVEAIRAAADAQLNVALDVVPQFDGEETKKKTTDGSHACSNGALETTIGRLARFFGKCLLRRYA